MWIALLDTFTQWSWAYGWFETKIMRLQRPHSHLHNVLRRTRHNFFFVCFRHYDKVDRGEHWAHYAFVVLLWMILLPFNIGICFLQMIFRQQHYGIWNTVAFERTASWSVNIEWSRSQYFVLTVWREMGNWIVSPIIVRTQHGALLLWSVIKQPQQKWNDKY